MIKENGDLVIAPLVFTKSNRDLAPGIDADQRTFEFYNDSAYKLAALKVYIRKVSSVEQKGFYDAIQLGDRFHFLSKGLYVLQGNQKTFFRTGYGSLKNNAISITIGGGEIEAYRSIEIPFGLAIPDYAEWTGLRKFELVFSYEKIT